MAQQDHIINETELDAVGVEHKDEEAIMSPDALDAQFAAGKDVGDLRRKSLVAQAVALQGQSMNPDAIGLMQAQPDIEAAHKQMVSDSWDSLERGIALYADDAVRRSIPTEQIIGNVNGMTSQVQEQREDPIAEEMSTMYRAASVPLEERVQREVALNMAVNNELVKMADAVGKMDFMQDGIEMMLPLREHFAWEQVESGIESNPVLSLYVNGDDVSEMITSWNRQSVERREVLTPVLMQTIADSLTKYPGFEKKLFDENTLVALGLISRFFQSEGATRAEQEHNIGLFFDVLDIGGTGVAIALGKINRMKGLKQLDAATAKVRASHDVPVTVDVSLDAAAEANLAKKAENAESAELQIARATLMNDLPTDVRKRVELIVANAAHYADKRFNMVENIAAAGDKPQAARVNLSAIIEPDIADTINIGKDIHTANAMPTGSQSWLPHVTGGLSEETGKQLNEFQRKADNMVRSMTTEKDMFNAGILTDSERGFALKSFDREIADLSEDYLMEGIQLTDLKITKESEVGFEFEYVLNASEGIERSHKGKRTWAVNEITGNFDETVKAGESLLGQIPGLSPTTWSAASGASNLEDFNGTARMASLLQNLESSTGKRLTIMMKDANKELGGFASTALRRDLDAIELAGDGFVNPVTQARGKVFTQKELLVGVETASGTVRLTDERAVKAYYKRRLVWDAYHEINNHGVFREKTLKGLQSTFVKAGGQETLIDVKPFDNVNAAKASVRNKQGFEVWDASSKETTRISDELLDEHYAKGRVLARLDEDFNPTGVTEARGGNRVEYILMEPENLKPLNQQQIHYHPGYVTKLMDGVEFVVQRKFTYRKAGAANNSGTKLEGLRAFASRKDAQNFIRLQAGTTAERLGIPLEDAMKLFDIGDGSVMSQIERMDNSLSGAAGMFGKQRAKGDILMGLDGVPLERLSPSEVFGRYTSHLAQKVAKNEWRVGTEKRWLNSVRNAFPNIEVKSFADTSLPPKHPATRPLERMRKQIEKWNRVPSKEESWYEQSMQAIHDWTLNGSRGMGMQANSVPLIQWLKHSNPISAWKSAVMHSQLGVLNPSQLFVQSLSATVALSLAPITKVPSILGNTVLFSVLDNIRNETTLGKMYKLVARNSAGFGDDIEDIGDSIEAYKLWRQSSLYGTIETSDDIGYMTSTGMGVARETMRKVENTSLLLYNTGEMANRRISFLSAYNTIKKAKPNAPVDNEFLRDVLIQTEKTMLELNSANAAYQQAGHGANGAQQFLSVFYQYKQVVTKYAELFIKPNKAGGFTAKQKARIAAGSLVMYGAAGNPIMKMVGAPVTDWVADKMGLDRDADADQIQSMANAYDQGFAGIMAHEILGAEVDISGRVALGIEPWEMMFEVMTSKDPLWKKALGASSGLARNISGLALKSSDVLSSAAMSEVAKMEPYMLFDRRGQEEINESDLKVVIGMIGEAALELPTSTRSLMAAKMMRNHHQIMDWRGNVRVRQDFNTATEIARAMGFTASEDSRVRDLQNINRRDTEEVQAMAEVAIYFYNKLAFQHKDDPKYAGQVKKLIQYHQELLGNDGLLEEYNSLLESKLFRNPQTTRERELNKFFKRHGEKVQAGLVVDSDNMFNSMFRTHSASTPFADISKKVDDQVILPDNADERTDLKEEE